MEVRYFGANVTRDAGMIATGPRGPVALPRLADMYRSLDLELVRSGSSFFLNRSSEVSSPAGRRVTYGDLGTPERRYSFSTDFRCFFSAVELTEA